MEDWENDLIDAISNQDIVKVKDLITPKSNLLDDKDSSYDKVISKALLKAVSLENLEIIRLIIEACANVQDSDPLGHSILNNVLHSDCSKAEDIALLFIENGADLNQRNANGNTNFMACMSAGVIKYSHVIDLLDFVADIHELDVLTGGSFLHLASKREKDPDRVRLIEKLLIKGIAINGLDNNEDTPLHLMVSIVCICSVQYLLDNGADIKSRNRLGESMLHKLASSNTSEGYSEMLKVLVERGIDINDIDFRGRTAIHHALMSKETACDALKEMQKYGININRKDFTGRNELFYAVMELDDEYTDEDIDSRIGVIEMLHQWNIAINEEDVYGVTPLHVATVRNNLLILGTLIDLGGDVTKRTNTGATPLHWSCKHYHMAYVTLCTYLKKRYSINVQDNYGSTPLHWAIWYRDIRVVQMLLQTGVDFNLRDNMGETPSELANVFYYDDFALLLKTYKTLEPLELGSDIHLECHGTDPLVACPLISAVHNAEEKVDMTEHLEHIKMHGNKLKRYIDVNLSSTNMGLFFNMHDNIIVQEVIHSLMHDVIGNISRQEPLFRCELHLAGSTFEGTNFGVPNEFDYLCNLVEFEKAFVPFTSPDLPAGYVKLKLKDEALLPQFTPFVTVDGFLDCKRLFRLFYGLINTQTENTLDSPKSKFSNIFCYRLLNELGYNISSLGIMYFGQQAKQLGVDIDIVPQIWVENLKPENRLTGSMSEYENGSSRNKVSVIFKTLERYRTRNCTQLFRVSYAYMEQSIIKVQPRHIKKAYTVLKALNESRYSSCPIYNGNRSVYWPITSYRLKTCFLHVLEEAHRTCGNILTDVTDCDNTAKLHDITILWAEKILKYFEKCVEENACLRFLILQRTCWLLKEQVNSFIHGKLLNNC